MARTRTIRKYYSVWQDFLSQSVTKNACRPDHKGWQELFLAGQITEGGNIKYSQGMARHLLSRTDTNEDRGLPLKVYALQENEMYVSC